MKTAGQWLRSFFFKIIKTQKLKNYKKEEPKNIENNNIKFVCKYCKLINKNI